MSTSAPCGGQNASSSSMKKFYLFPAVDELMTGRLTGVSSITRRPFCLLNQWKRSINELQAHTCANSAAAELVTSQLIVFPEQKIPGRRIPIKFHSNSNDVTIAISNLFSTSLICALRPQHTYVHLSGDNCTYSATAWNFLF